MNSTSYFLRLAPALLATMAALPLSGHAAPVGIDGNIGTEWAGFTPVTVMYSAVAPTSNFQAATNLNHITSYEIFTRLEGNFLYTALRTTGANGDSAGLAFANLYYSLRYGPGPVGNNGSSIGFEVQSDRAFFPGGNGNYFNDTAANLIQSSIFTGDATEADVIEVAIDLSVFLDNALGVTGFGIPAGQTPVGIRLNLSQSFGYSVAGGQAFYGDNRLGFVALPDVLGVPEPASLALVGAALAGAAVVTRRRRPR